eukprot:gene4924-5282_t
MTEVSHHDAARKAVGKTALLAAGCRSIESLKGETNRLIYDELAIKCTEAEKLEELMKMFPKVKLDTMVEGVAVRTRKIDEEIAKGLSEASQIVTLGAGLDSRPWRIHHYLQGKEQEEVFVESLSSKKWYEIDFQEIFDFKGHYVSQLEKSPFQYIPVVGNACTDNWIELLHQQGFDSREKTIWILEGFVTYLTEEEVRRVFTMIASITAPGSKLISTFAGPNNQYGSDMHRFRTSNPAEFLNEWNWRSEQINFPDLMAIYNRVADETKDYYVVVSYLQ